jgi:hypothetical protein
MNNQLVSTATTKEEKLLRSVKLNKLKYYYFSDLTNIYGSGFVKYLQTPLIKRRVLWGTNSNDCRLVNASEFKSALKTFKSSISNQTEKKVRTTKQPEIKQKNSAVKEEKKAKVDVLPCQLELPTADIKLCEQKPASQLSVAVCLPSHIDAQIHKNKNEKFFHMKQMKLNVPIEIKHLTDFELNICHDEIVSNIINFKKIYYTKDEKRFQDLFKDWCRSFDATMSAALKFERKKLSDLNLDYDPDIGPKKRMHAAGVYHIFHKLVIEAYKFII